MANKWTPNASLNSTNNKKKSINKSRSPSSSSDEESVEEEKTTKPLTSKLEMQLKQNNKSINESNNLPPNDSSLTEPSNDNRFNSRRVPLGKTGGQQSFEKNKTGLNRSSSAAILKLLKSSTKTDIGLDRVEEDDEIDALLMQLEEEGVDNIDWDELNVDHEVVKQIIENEKVDDSDESSDEDSSDDDDEAVHMIINRQAPAQESDEDFEVVCDEESD